MELNTKFVSLRLASLSISVFLIVLFLEYVFSGFFFMIPFYRHHIYIKIEPKMRDSVQIRAFEVMIVWKSYEETVKSERQFSWRLNMGKTRYLAFFVLLSIVLFSCAPTAPEKEMITTETLFREMIDMVNLSYYPEPSYRTVQFSSFDRRSNLPGGPDWFANSDGFGGEPIPNFEDVLQEPGEGGIGEYLIADVQGPGAIVRLWTAAITGKIKFFIDDEMVPLYDGPAQDFFQKPYDSFPEVENLDKELLERTVYQRDASYAPIPFAKSMHLVWKGDVNEIHFYQVGVRIYQNGTHIQSFAATDFITYRETINHVLSALSDPDKNLELRSQHQPLSFSAELDPSKKAELLSLEGPKAVERLEIQIEATDMDRALRQTVLYIICDDYPWGQVQSPVGDFFGAAPGINPYQSLPFTVQPDGRMLCRFVMPFKWNVKVMAENQGEQNIKVKGSALLMDYTWDEERSMHFRARWRADHNLIASNTAVQDLPFIIAHGKGVYVGTASYLLNPSDVPTPYGSWWGEGDEKVFIDDDPVPSTFGTGSEDYYNYSWSSPDIFYFPYCGQPRNDGPGNRGFVTNFRWHILDPFPFKSRIQFYLELYSHEPTPGLSYARMGYHYARPGVSDDHLAIMPEDLRLLEPPEGWKPAARMGARDSVFYEAEQIIRDRIHTRRIDGRLWSDGRLLVWRPRNIGESKAFSFRIREKGEYRVHFAAALIPNSGRISYALDDRFLPLSNDQEILDLRMPHRNLLRNFTFPSMDFEPGRHTLIVRFEGASSEVENPEIGIDFIWIQKTKQ
jgi:hypothetical protein